MAGNTPNLNLYYRDPATDGDQLFDVKAMMNDNWDKIDAAAADWTEDSQTNAADISALEGRLNTAASANLILAAGTQTIQAVKDAPFNFTGASGRVLLNTLGQDGNCESLRPWTFLGGVGALDSTNKSAGQNSIKLTLNDVAGQFSKAVPTVTGGRYILIAEIKLNSASSARVQVSGLGTGSNVTSSGGFVRSFMRFIATTSSHTIAVSASGAMGNTLNVDAIRLYQVSQELYDASAQMSYSDLGTTFPYTEGLAGVRNPYAIRWNSSDKTEIRSMLAFQTELLADPVLGTDADLLKIGADGQYYKSTIWRKTVLLGELSYVLLANRTGYKVIEYTGDAVNGGVANSQTAIKFDGSILGKYNYGVTDSAADRTSYSGSALPITVLNSDSGWGDTYNPTADELRAYMLGWKMYDASTNASDGLGVYSRTDGTNKRWTPLASYDGTGYSGNVSTVPNARPEQFIAGGYRISRKVVPYEVLYRRAIAYTEPVPFEGELSLTENDNVIEVGSGIVLREKTTPYRDGSAWSINNGTTGYESSLTKQKADKFLAVYKDNRVDQWTLYDSTTTAAGALAQQAFSKYDLSAVYTASYMTADKYPTSSIFGSVGTNEKAVLKDLIEGVQQSISRAAALDLRKGDKNAAGWNSVTLQNGWAGLLNFSFRVEGSRLYFRGIISGGITSPLTQLFVIPAAYATKRAFTATVGTYSGNSTATVALDFFTDGRVQIINSNTGSLTSIAFEGFSYPLD